ncbi:MAG TPA: Hsp20/alpha crystallin family protein [Gemmatimonadaceae bacterium]|jgi:HSP20 family protein
MPRTELERKQGQRMPITYSPLGSAFAEEIADFKDQFRRMLGDAFPVPTLTTPLGYNPAIDILENAEEITITAELPGLTKNDMRITFDDGMLTIQGEKREEKPLKDESKQYHVYERSYGSFTRTFALPRAVDDKHIKAEFHDGVLTVHLPKSADMKRNGKPIDIAG